MDVIDQAASCDERVAQACFEKAASVLESSSEAVELLGAASLLAMPSILSRFLIDAKFLSNLVSIYTHCHIILCQQQSSQQNDKDDKVHPANP